MDTRETLVYLVAFLMVALASQRIGAFCGRFRFPLITGFLLSGVLAGPELVGLLSREAVEKLRFVDDVALAYIAFAAGAELRLGEIRRRLRIITWVTAAQTFLMLGLGVAVIFMVADELPILRDLPTGHRIAAGLLAGSILLARSPSSAIAVVRELRAKGPFTQTVLGVTVITDAVVIVAFAAASSVGDALVNGVAPDFFLLILVLGELILSVLLGVLVFLLLRVLLALPLAGFLKSGLLLALGFAVFRTSSWIRHATGEHLPVEILLEPLLICMVATFVLANVSRHRDEVEALLHQVGDGIFVIFFTLTGASLSLDVLVKSLGVTLVFGAARLFGIFFGSFAGGALAGEPARFRRLSWLAYVTQAGIGLGLAKELSAEFPGFGAPLATILVSVIVVNQLIGPPLFRLALLRVGEAHPRAVTPEFDGVRDALIFGLEDKSLALARQLRAHGWQVKIASRKVDQPVEVEAREQDPGIDIHPISGLTREALHELEAEKAEVIVGMLSDDENLTVLELAYEHFGTALLVVRLHDPARGQAFKELGALVVDPSTALVSLLDHAVRSPATTSILLGMDQERDIVDVEVCDPELDGLAVRDLHLPLDTLILAVRRDGHMLVTQGYNRLALGDVVTVVGSPESLEDVILRFESVR
jgi:Trk K+ transport system NAD-binding subunit/Kef-type K+ transport system membrane component KefB